MKPDIRVLSSCIPYQGFFQVREDILEKQDLTKHTFASLILPRDAAVVLAENGEGKYILNYEYRHPTSQFLLGCPGGLFEPEEDPIQAARRELLEETGYLAETIYLTGSAYPFPGVCGQKVYYFFAKNAQFKQPPQLDPMERIDIQFKTHEELIYAIANQSNIDGILCAALWFKEMFEKNKNGRA
jgi:ADP-ribose pyrophosphatase